MSRPEPFDSNPESNLHFTDIREAGPAAMHNRYWRGILWLIIALAGALWLGLYLGMLEYVQRWAGSLFAAASGGWLGFRFSKALCRIDPSGSAHGIERGLMHLARALCIVGLAIAVCVKV